MSIEASKALLEGYGAVPNIKYVRDSERFAKLSGLAMIVLMCSVLFSVCAILPVMVAMLIAMIALIIAANNPLVLYDPVNKLCFEEVDIHRHYIRQHKLAKACCILMGLGMLWAFFFLFWFVGQMFGSGNTMGDIAYLMVYVSVAASGLVIVGGAFAVQGVLISRLFTYLHMRKSVTRLMTMMLMASLFIISLIATIYISSAGIYDDVYVVVPPMLFGIFFWAFLLGTTIDTYKAAKQLRELNRYLVAHGYAELEKPYLEEASQDHS